MESHGICPFPVKICFPCIFCDYLAQLFEITFHRQTHTDGQTLSHKLQRLDFRRVFPSFSFEEDLALTTSIVFHHIQSRAGEDQYDQSGKLKHHARPYTRNGRDLKNNHPLMLMIEHRRPNLLAHPVCVHLIKHKWASYGR